MKKLIALGFFLFLSGSAYAYVPVNYMVIPSYMGYRGKQGSAAAMLPNAVYYYKNKNYAEAKREINEIIQCCPNDAQAQFLKSQIYYASGDLDEALNSVNKAISMTSDNKLYLWRAFMLIQSNDTSKLPQITQDIRRVAATDKSNYDSYYEKTLNGRYNEYLWNLLYHQNISSAMISPVFKSLLKDIYSNYELTSTVPVLASYIQYIYILDNSDAVFKEYNKNKDQILQMFITPQKGQYSGIISGLLVYASGDTTKGAEQINTGFKNVVVKSENLHFACDIIANTMHLIRPYARKYVEYDIGIEFSRKSYGYTVKKVFDNSPAQANGVQVGDIIYSINGFSLTGSEKPEEVTKMIRGNQNSSVKIEFGHPKIFSETKYTRIIPRTIKVSTSEIIKYRLPDAELSNKYRLSNYVLLENYRFWR